METNTMTAAGETAVSKLGNSGGKGGKTFSHVLLYLALALLSLAFLLFFSVYTTPLSSGSNGADAAFFRLVGKGMTRGYLPYRDFFDMKGPYLFLIEYIGALISDGRTGIFLLQWINLFLSMLILCRIFKLYGLDKPWLQLLILVPCAWVAAFTFEGGNLTEEFSLVPLLSCLWLCLRYFLGCGNGEHCHCVWVGGWYGVCFGFLALVRITNAALICAIVLVICIELLKAKEYRNLLYNGLAFVAGVCLALLPMIIYYAANGLLRDMLYAVFVLGIKYSGEKTMLEHLRDLKELTETSHILAITWMPTLMALICRWRSWRERTLLAVGTAATVLAAAMGNAYLHYFTLCIPMIAMGGVIMAESIRADKKKAKTWIVLLLYCGALWLQKPNFKEQFDYSKRLILYRDSFDTEEKVRDIAARIPEEERDSVFCYNLNPSWYTYADLLPCIKYCGWQNHYIELIPQIEDDLKECFREEPPKWLVLPSEVGDIPAFLKKEIAENYRPVYRNQDYVLLNHN